MKSVPPSFALLCLLMLGGVVILAGCKVDTVTAENKYDKGMTQSLAPQQDSKSAIVRPDHSVMREQAAKIQEEQKRDYASYAARTSFMCPKLLTKPIDNARIQRRNEVMKNNYCEYYIYPQAGQSINVVSNDDRIERLLVSPTIYNFANGAYVADNKNRHTIRLNYNSVTRKPSDFRYDIEIIIN